MQVYEKRPTGLSVKELTAHANRAPRAAVFALVRGLVGIVLIGLLGVPLGLLWAVIGIALLGSVFLFVQAAARAAIRRPALVLTGRPSWDGIRRTSWSVESDDLPETLRRLAEALDGTLGASLTAYDEGAEFRGITRREAFGAPTHPVLFAWGVDGGKPHLAATGTNRGVWIRMEYDRDDRLIATVLADDGVPVATLTQVARRV